MNYVADTLIKTRKLIIRSDTWCQGAYEIHKPKSSINYCLSTKRCLTGAIAAAMNYPASFIGRGDMIDDIIEHVSHSIRAQVNCNEKIDKFTIANNIDKLANMDYLLAYNDYSSHKEVIEVLDHAIDMANKIGRAIALEAVAE